MKKNRTTIHDIARELNVTASTVSRALNDHPAISEATREAVFAAAERLNYRPNHLASALRSGKSNLIGVVVPAADRSFFGKAIRGIEEEVTKAGYSVLVCQTYDEPEKEKLALDALLRTRVDGIIASVAKLGDHFEHYRKIQKEGVPIVFFDNVAEKINVSSVCLNDYLGAYQAVEHLIGQGCRRIVHFAGNQNARIYRERLRGYKAALADHGLEIAAQLIMECPSDVALGKQRAAEILEMQPLPDAIFSASDYAVLGAMQYFKLVGISIPKEIALVGFANEDFGSYVEPALSSVEQHSRSMGRYAARVFLEEVDTREATFPKQAVLQPELIIRASSLIRGEALRMNLS